MGPRIGELKNYKIYLKKIANKFHTRNRIFKSFTGIFGYPGGEGGRFGGDSVEIQWRFSRDSVEIQ
jgi:hypothetical protein